MISICFVFDFDCDRQVEDCILKILRQRAIDCNFYHEHQPDKVKYCHKIEEEYKTAETNWFAKCKQFCSFGIVRHI